MKSEGELREWARRRIPWLAAAGLELATRLSDQLGRRRLADVTLIDKSRTHLWKPLLHEFAAGSMDQSVHEIDFIAHAHWHYFRYRVGEMIDLDRTKREVQIAARIWRSMMEKP